MDPYVQQNMSVRCITHLWEPNMQEGLYRDPTAMLSRGERDVVLTCARLKMQALDVLEAKG